MLRVSAIYPNQDGSHFDGQDYVRRHIPFAQSLLTPLGLQSVRITLGETALDGTPPPFWAVCEMLFEDRETFDRAMSASGPALFADAPHYTNVDPLLQLSTLIGPLP